MMRRFAAPARAMRTMTALALALAVLTAVGCGSAPRDDTRPAGPQTLRLTEQIGGTHTRLVISDDVWYQAFGTGLLILRASSARKIREIELAPLGEAGPAVDLLLDDDGQLVAVLDEDMVVVLDATEPERPRIVERITAEELGIRPRRLSIVGGEVFVSGYGGVVRLRDGARMFSSASDVSRVAMSNGGLAACVDRQILLLRDGGFAGSATDLLDVHVPGAHGSADGGGEPFLFVRQVSAGALVGLMRRDLREVHADYATTAVPGTVHAVRVIDDEIWVVTADELLVYRAEGERLQRVRRVDVLGARDVARIDENHLAVAGTFGRAVYRERGTESGPGDTFLHVNREPSGLERAKSDGRYIVAGGEKGTWQYLIGSTAQLASVSVDDDPPPPDPPTRAAARDAEARIIDDGAAVRITMGDREYVHREHLGGSDEAGAVSDPVLIHCVVAVEGDFWFGTDRGIFVLRAREPDAPRRMAGASRGAASGVDWLEERGRLRLHGPVRYLFPLRVDPGAAFVSEYGGFGIAKFVSEPAGG